MVQVKAILEVTMKVKVEKDCFQGVGEIQGSAGYVSG